MAQPFDLLLTGGIVVSDAGCQRADVAVRDGRIAALLPDGQPSPARQVLTVAGRFILPGLIDAHVHMRTPGLTHKEDWRHGSRAAVAGGITTVADMPNTVPPLLRGVDAWAKHRAVHGSSLVDYRFHAGVSAGSIADLAGLSSREATTVKVFMSGHHTAHHVINDPDLLEQVFQVAATQDKVLVCHAEDHDLLRTDSRRAAVAATARLIDLAKRTGARTHVLHVSSWQEVELLTTAAEYGIPVSFEVTGHHLSFTERDVRRVGARLRLRPAIRDELDRDRLWQAVISGARSLTVGSDHAPHTAAEKALPGEQAPPGLPGVQELLFTLYSGLLRRSLPPAAALGRVADVLAAAPARLLGIHHRKGRIVPGMDADLVIFDPARTTILRSADIQSKCGWSPYRGMAFSGGIDRTIRRGETVYAQEPSGTEFGVPSGVWL